jgi:hypothetical protein
MTGRSAGTVFRDFTLLMVLGFVAMVVWLLPHINPPESAANLHAARQRRRRGPLAAG